MLKIASLSRASGGKKRRDEVGFRRTIFSFSVAVRGPCALDGGERRVWLDVA